MSKDNAMNLKIFLKGNNVNEVRRIIVDPSVATSFIFMKEKLQTVFPVLRNSPFKMTWQDVDDDEITIASDEDLITAFTEMHGNVKIITVTILQGSADSGVYVCAVPEEPPKPTVVCDGCDKKIMGFRYKCLQCPDYDLCADCEFQGCHSNHVMIRLPNNETYSPRCARKFMHHITRSLKKSAHCARKEAHRASKHASKCRQNDSSAEEDNQPSGCPFTAKDAHEFGALAHQTFSEIFKPVDTQDKEKKSQGLVLLDVLQNVMDGFFGHPPATQPQPENSTKSNPANQPTSMEVEPSAPPIYPVLPQEAPNLTTPAPEKATRTTANSLENNQNPDWTFVASNNQTENNSSVAPQTNEPQVALIYHENPIIAEGLVKLHEMGFSNETGVLSNLLEHFNGNVNDVVKAIFDRNI